MNGNLIGAVNNPSSVTTTGIWDLEEVKLAQQQNLWPLDFTKDTYWNSVRLLLNSDTATTNGAQNNTFLDSSTNNLTITRNGNTTQGSFSPFGSNWSNYFDGTGDYLSTPYNTATQFGTGDFTVEAWVYMTAALSLNDAIASVANDWQITWSTSGFCLMPDGSNRLCNTNNYTTMSTGVWYHVAFTRQSGTLRSFLNGNLAASVANSTNFSDVTNGIRIGVNRGTTNYFTGYISNFRAIKGTALYTASFTPSASPLTTVSGTGLLTCQSSGFIDNSGNNLTVTKNGDTRITKFSPFNLINGPYNSTQFGGSAYFDGTGDYLTTTLTNTIGTGDFTFEAWVYYTGSLTGTTNNSIFTINGSNDFYVQFYQNVFRVWCAGLSTSYIDFTGITNYTWYHVAVTRSGSTLRLFLDGSLKSSGTTTANIIVTNAFIGSLSAATGWWTGNISSLRLITGTALYTSSFTPPTSPLTAVTNTRLLMNSTNGGIIDSSTGSIIETVGNAQVSTSVKKYGSGSLLFDGTGDYLNILSTVGVIGSLDFTVEGWFRHTSAGQAAIWWDNATATFADNNFSIRTDYIDSTRSIYCWVGGVSTTFSYTSAVTFLNNWVHVALVRSGNSLKLYLNGTVCTGTGALNTTTVDLTTLKIGGAPAPSSGYSSFTGNISDFRITVGYARYTANFTPPGSSLPRL